MHAPIPFLIIHETLLTNIYLKLKNYNYFYVITAFGIILNNVGGVLSYVFILYCIWYTWNECIMSLWVLIKNFGNLIALYFILSNLRTNILQHIPANRPSRVLTRSRRFYVHVIVMRLCEPNRAEHVLILNVYEYFIKYII